MGRWHVSIPSQYTSSTRVVPCTPRVKVQYTHLLRNREKLSLFRATKSSSRASFFRDLLSRDKKTIKRTNRDRYSDAKRKDY